MINQLTTNLSSSSRSWECCGIGSAETACEDVLAALQWLDSLGGRRAAALCPHVTNAGATGAQPLLRVRSLQSAAASSARLLTCSGWASTMAASGMNHFEFQYGVIENINLNINMNINDITEILITHRM